MHVGKGAEESEGEGEAGAACDRDTVVRTIARGHVQWTLAPAVRHILTALRRADGVPGALEGRERDIAVRA